MTITNAMRLLKRAGIPFDTAEYAVDEEDLSGVHAAEALGTDPARVFKTLVARGEKKGLRVFCIPVGAELDLKKCAALCGEKKIELVQVKELMPLTGYVRGGCSPVGMKKRCPTVIDASAEGFERIYVSAGLRGQQLILRPDDLRAFTGAAYADIVKE